MAASRPKWALGRSITVRDSDNTKLNQEETRCARLWQQDTSVLTSPSKGKPPAASRADGDNQVEERDAWLVR